MRKSTQMSPSIIITHRHGKEVVKLKGFIGISYPYSWCYREPGESRSAHRSNHSGIVLNLVIVRKVSKNDDCRPHTEVKCRTGAQVLST